MSNPYEPSHLPPKPLPPGSQESISALDAVIPTNPLAAIACWSGIIGILLCPCAPVLGPIAIVTGVLSLRTGGLPSSQFGQATSKVRSWIGIVTGIIGTVLALLVLVMVVIGNLS